MKWHNGSSRRMTHAVVEFGRMVKSIVSIYFNAEIIIVQSHVIYPDFLIDWDVY